MTDDTAGLRAHLEAVQARLDRIEAALAGSVDSDTPARELVAELHRRGLIRNG